MTRLTIASFILCLGACGSSPAPAPSTAATPAQAQSAADSAAALGPVRKGAVTRGGSPLTLLGPELAIGDPMPEFMLTANDMSDVTYDQYAGKVLVLSIVPSLDTGVCAQQTRTFNQKASELSDEVVILTVSMDLPFAQRRFCGAEGIERVITASDYKYREFGPRFGVLIEELGLLARAVFVVDRERNVVHAEYVSEISQEPDYEPALKAVEAAL